jgi:RNA recognition motif-containing protein
VYLYRPASSLSRSQIRQGIANTTKGTAFVVYEDVMDAKQACDKLNGFNFQNRYLVGTSHLPNRFPSRLPLTSANSALPPTREDGQVERRPRGAQGQSRSSQTTTRYRITICADDRGEDCTSAGIRQRRRCWRSAGKRARKDPHSQQQFFQYE